MFGNFTESEFYGVFKFVGKWRAIVDNRTNKDGLFALRDNIGSDMLEVYNEKSRLIDLPQRSLFHETANSEITANMLAEIVNQSIAKRDEWPSWDVRFRFGYISIEFNC